MGKQVNFFAVSSDFDVLRDALLGIEPFLVLNYESPTSRPELDRCYYDGSVCRRGRLYFRGGYYLDDGRWHDKPIDFVQWAERVLRLTRRIFRRDPGLGAYLGPEAEKLLRGGAVRFDVNA